MQGQRENGHQHADECGKGLHEHPQPGAEMRQHKLEDVVELVVVLLHRNVVLGRRGTVCYFGVGIYVGALASVADESRVSLLELQHHHQLDRDAVEGHEPYRKGLLAVCV